MRVSVRSASIVEIVSPVSLVSKNSGNVYLGCVQTFCERGPEGLSRFGEQLPSLHAGPRPIRRSQPRRPTPGPMPRKIRVALGRFPPLLESPWSHRKIYPFLPRKGRGRGGLTSVIARMETPFRCMSDSRLTRH